MFRRFSFSHRMSSNRTACSPCCVRRSARLQRSLALRALQSELLENERRRVAQLSVLELKEHLRQLGERHGAPA